MLHYQLPLVFQATHIISCQVGIGIEGGGAASLARQQSIGSHVGAAGPHQPEVLRKALPTVPINQLVPCSFNVDCLSHMIAVVKQLLACL